jgi:hypothetical protein
MGATHADVLWRANPEQESGCRAKLVPTQFEPSWHEFRGRVVSQKTFGDVPTQKRNRWLKRNPSKLLLNWSRDQFIGVAEAAPQPECERCRFLNVTQALQPKPSTERGRDAKALSAYTTSGGATSADGQWRRSGVLPTQKQKRWLKRQPIEIAVELVPARDEFIGVRRICTLGSMRTLQILECGAGASTESIESAIAHARSLHRRRDDRRRQ